MPRSLAGKAREATLATVPDCKAAKLDSGGGSCNLALRTSCEGQCRAPEASASRSQSAFPTAPYDLTEQNKPVSWLTRKVSAMSAAKIDIVAIAALNRIFIDERSERGKGESALQIGYTLHKAEPLIKPKVSSKPNNASQSIAQSGEAMKMSEKRLTVSAKLFLLSYLHDDTAHTRFVGVTANAVSVANVGGMRQARFTHNRTKPG